MQKIIRVFPKRTSFTPDDDLVFIGSPPLFIPDHDEVHVSCTFTWDMDYCEQLAYQWEGATSKPVKLGGVAYHSEVNGFCPGMYVKKGVVFTSRGCNNNCGFCIVPKNEGNLMELPIFPGNIIQDNNFLQCSQAHKDRVFEMLKTQRQICFKGGLQANLIDDHFVENCVKIQRHISEIWLACDTPNSIDSFKTGCQKLTNVGFNRNKIRCYVLIGDDMKENEERLRAVYEAGAMPFAQLLQPYERKRREYTESFSECGRDPPRLGHTWNKGRIFWTFRRQKNEQSKEKNKTSCCAFVSPT